MMDLTGLKREEIIAKLREHYQSPVWITHEGDFVPLAIMEQGHMRNCIRQVRRQIDGMYKDLGRIYAYVDSKDAYSAAGYAAEGEALQMEGDLDHLHLTNYHLLNWWKRRGFGDPPEMEK